GYLRQRMASGGKFYHFADREGGANTGAVALLGLTLVESGANFQDADVQKAATQVRQHAQSLKFTYSIALSILFLDRLSADRPKDTPAEDADLIRKLALRLIGSQNAKAGWDYHCRVLSAIEEQNLLKNLESGQHQVGDTAKNVPVREYDDNSIGQFVTLALWTARKHNLPVRSTLLAIEERYRAKRRPEGNWSYNETNPFLKDSSTCAALIGLAVGRGIRDKEEVGKSNLLKDDAVMSGLDHIKSILRPGRAVAASEIAIRKKHTADMEAVFALMETTNDQKEFDEARAKLLELDKSPLMSGHFFGGDNWGDLYFLWSLERLCMIYGLDKIGDVDWHEWGSDFILTSQQADGSWQERFPGVPDTCFAMLFLMRANVAKDLTDKLRELMQGAGVQQQPGAPPKRE
ncbi:MAG TPA: hypothetical protein VE988_12530, partial [Gemmataceae bacterium]|nr:hypothetical protein [Gemmataceae bacterium]